MARLCAQWYFSSENKFSSYSYSVRHKQLQLKFSLSSASNLRSSSRSLLIISITRFNYHSSVDLAVTLSFRPLINSFRLIDCLILDDYMGIHTQKDTRFQWLFHAVSTTCNDQWRVHIQTLGLSTRCRQVFCEWRQVRICRPAVWHYL